MIVDCHTHVWDSSHLAEVPGPSQRWRGLRGLALRGSEDASLDASPERHLRATGPADKTFVLGFKSRHLGVEIPNAFVANYVRQHPDKLVGAAGIDPSSLSEALEDMRLCRDELDMKAITVAPAAQDFHPADSRAMQIFSEAARTNTPVFLNHGIQVTEACKLEFARPALLDEVARELPDLKMVIAQMGYPWVEECVVLLGKHANVFADISLLMHRPWHAYNALLSAYHYGVMDKLLLGSGFPFGTAASTIESLFRINQLVTGTNLPTVPRPHLAGIVERNALALLGIESSPQALNDDATLLEAHDL